MNLYANSPPPTEQPRPLRSSNRLRTSAIITVTLFLLTAVGWGSYLLGVRQGERSADPTEQPPAQPSRQTWTPPQLSPTMTPTTDWIMYSNQQYGFTFRYPLGLDSSCCAAVPPPGTRQLLISLADQSTVLPQSDKPFDGFSVYVEPNPQSLTFEQYMGEQKEALLQNLESFVGPKPLGKPTELVVIVGGRRAIMLRSYVWPEDLIYVALPDNQRILVIAESHDPTRDFGTVFSQILSTFEFGSL